MASGIGLWIGFTLIVLGLLFLDLGVFHREAREVVAQGSRDMERGSGSASPWSLTPGFIIPAARSRPWNFSPAI